MSPHRLLAHAGLAAALALGLTATATTAAQADTYATGTNSQDFTTSAGGWTGSVENSGLCLPAVTCPAVTNDYVATGGADGNGYLRTSILSVLTTVAATVNAHYDSPAFTYQGNGGKVPATASFNMNVRPALGSLVGGGLLDQSTYRVDLLQQGTSRQVNVVPATPLTASTAWSAIPTASVDPAQLAIGGKYILRITTTYNSVLGLVATGEVGFDNVRLTTAGTAGSNGGGNGQNGENGSNGGSGITSTSELRTTAMTSIIPGSANLEKGTVKVKLKCPKKAGPQKCAVNVKGLAGGKKSKAATKGARAKLKAGKSRVVTLKVKPGNLAAYLKASKVFLKSKVKVGSVHVTVVKKVKLKH